MTLNTSFRKDKERDYYDISSCEGEKGWWWWLNCSSSEQESDSDALSIVWLSVMVKHFDLQDILERLDDDDPDFYSEEESDCELAGICAYTPVVSGDWMDDLPR